MSSTDTLLLVGAAVAGYFVWKKYGGTSAVATQQTQSLTNSNPLLAPAPNQSSAQSGVMISAPVIQQQQPISLAPSTPIEMMPTPLPPTNYSTDPFAALWFGAGQPATTPTGAPSVVAGNAAYQQAYPAQPVWTQNPTTLQWSASTASTSKTKAQILEFLRAQSAAWAVGGGGGKAYCTTWINQINNFAGTNFMGGYCTNDFTQYTADEFWSHIGNQLLGNAGVSGLGWVV